MFNVNRSMSFVSDTSSFHNRSFTRSSLASESLHDPELNFDEKSPLELFGAAKDQINSIFREISEFVTDVTAFDSDLKNYSTFSKAPANKEVQSFVTKLSAIRDILKRDKMKVAFFGRTSSGKSTLINAMLASEILPSGIGHTTNCFIQVENSDSNDSYLCIGDTKDKRNIETVSQLGNALCDGKLSENEKATIYWSKNRCPLLSHDVVFIDSPGIDGFDNLDDFIVKYCLDADVFVLVSNVEAVLSISERNFFNKVSAKISKPNIFLLYNKWDYADSVPEYREKLRQQHLDGSILFLSKKLNISTEAEAVERTFFISAKEALLTRIQSNSEILPSLSSDSYQKRYFEFQHFEKKFEECISKSAIQTKFGEHLKCGKQMIQYILQYVDNLLKEVQHVKVTNLKDLDELSTQLCIIEEDLMKGQKEIKDQIQNTTESVEQRVTQALNDEIRRLKNILDEFAIPFSPDTAQLPHYICELSQHVKRSLDENLKSKLMKSIMEKIQKSQIDITNRVLSSVPKPFYQVEYENYHKRMEEEQEFEIKYYFNVVQLSAGFNVNLDFRFRWSIHNIFQKYAARAFSMMSGTRIDNSNGLSNQMNTIGSQSLVSHDSFPILLKTALLSFGPESSLVVLGLLMKSVGWRVIFFGSVFYGSLYAYERMKWTTKAKSKVFQDQYISFISNRLKLVMNETSSDCSQQVMQKLSSTFIAMCKIVHNSMNSMHNKRYEIEARIKEAIEMADKCKILRNKAIYLSKQLDEFEDSFL